MIYLAYKTMLHYGKRDANSGSCLYPVLDCPTCHMIFAWNEFWYFFFQNIFHCCCWSFLRKFYCCYIRQQNFTLSWITNWALNWHLMPNPALSATKTIGVLCIIIWLTCCISGKKCSICIKLGSTENEIMDMLDFTQLLSFVTSLHNV